MSQPAFEFDDIVPDEVADPTFSVGELADAINEELRRGFRGGAWVRGEISGEIDSDSPTLALSYVESQAYAQRASVTATGVEVSLQVTKPCSRAPLRRIELPEGLVALMTDLAARTFVPETEASRLSGAGAGLTDND